MKDYYEILGVDRNADAETIKQKYRALVRQYHPDINKDPEAESKTKDINEAYEILSNPDKKAAYDNPMPQGMPSGGFGFNPNDFFGFRDPFENIGFGAQNMRKNSQVEGGIDIELRLAMKNNKVRFKYKRMLSCPLCNKPENTSTCATCNGKGIVIQVIQQGPMQIHNHRSCPACGGMGKTYDTNCNTCHGLGIYQIEEEMLLDVPAQAIGKTMIIPQKGNQEFSDMEPGPLAIQIRPSKNKHYIVLSDLTCLTWIKVNPVKAMLGGKVKIKNIEDNDTYFDLPPNISHGDKIIIDTNGLFRSEQERAPIVAEVVYDMPELITDKQKKILESYLAKTENSYSQGEIS